MNSAHGLTAENLLRALPEVLRKDKNMEALAASIAQVLAQRPEEIQRLAIYPNIDALPEELLDILACDFKVDWWDAGYTLEEKRRTLKDSWRVHRMLGTKAAVELAISAIFPMARVSEWFAYGGEPYHFRLAIDVSQEDTNSERYRRVLERVNFYKNLRSHLDKIIYIIQAEGVAAGYGAAAYTGGYMRNLVPVHTGGEVRPPRIPVTAAAGAVLLGRRLRMTAQVQNNGPVHPPSIPAAAAAGAGPFGRYLRMTVPVKHDGPVRPPHIPVPAASGAHGAGAYLRLKAGVTVEGVGKPQRPLPAHTGVKAPETYYKITTEVSM